MILEKQEKEILDRISYESGLNNFFLGGSLPYQRIAKKVEVDFECKDYDLAIVGGREKVSQIRKILNKNGFEITVDRPYFLKFKEIHQFVAKKKNIILDIAILKDISYLGHFNWESIFWKFPSKEIYDPYNSLDSILKGELKLIIPIENENPFILTSRFAKLCARFNINFIKNKSLYSLSLRLSKRIKNWKPFNTFQGEYAQGHAYFGIIQSILRSRNKKGYIEMLKKSGILDAIFPEINRNLDYIDLKEEIEAIQNPEELIFLFQKSLVKDKVGHKSFNKKIKLISNKLDLKKLKDIKNK